MTKLKTKHLTACNACPTQIALFLSLWPKGEVEVTLENLRIAEQNGLNIKWLIENFLEEMALTEYKRIVQTALYNYKHTVKMARIEYEHVSELAWAKLQEAREKAQTDDSKIKYYIIKPATANYRDVTTKAWNIFTSIEAAAKAKYHYVRDPALIKALQQTIERYQP